MLEAHQIAKMTREEKLRTMEALWADLAAHEAEVETPSWHQKALQETERRLAAGSEEVLDWDGAKRELRQRSE
jgi:hypothetical protein